MYNKAQSSLKLRRLKRYSSKTSLDVSKDMNNFTNEIIRTLMINNKFVEK